MDEAGSIILGLIGHAVIFVVIAFFAWLGNTYPAVSEIFWRIVFLGGLVAGLFWFASVLAVAANGADR